MKSSLGDATSSLGDDKSSLGDAKSSLGDGVGEVVDCLRGLGLTEASDAMVCDGTVWLLEQQQRQVCACSAMKRCES